jgi:2-methylisocitrate lyase-like PEP mutase family enzyme
MRSQAEKARTFRALHERDRAFVIPNPWDLGSLRSLEQLGFEAIATTSAGFARSIGKADGDVERDEMIEHCGILAAATDLPVSADLENGYADDPADVAETVRLAAAAGLAGCSIEDLPLHRVGEPYEISFAAERVRAAAEAAHALPFPFTLTARAENYIADRPDLADTIARLQAFQEAGADVLYAPGLRSKEDIGTVVRAVDRPVNVLAGLRGMQLTLAELSDLGVKRVSIGGGLARAAYDAAFRVAQEIRDRGTFTLLS